MGDKSANFAFLRAGDERLVRLAMLAERYAFADPPAALMKLRKFGELRRMKEAA